MQMYMLSSDLKTSISVSWSGSALLLMEISLRYSLQLTENPLTSTDTRLAIALAWPGESISRPSALTSQFQVNVRSVQHSVFNVKALVGTFNHEQGPSSRNRNLWQPSFEALLTTSAPPELHITPWWPDNAGQGHDVSTTVHCTLDSGYVDTAFNLITTQTGEGMCVIHFNLQLTLKTLS